MAAVLNAANNALNQIYDLDIDRVNKPKRPLPSGALTVGEAWAFTLVTAFLAWVLAWLASPDGRRECFWIVVFTTLLCWIYSAPPLWTKRRGFLANVTIAIPRGVLLKVAGWSTVKTILGLEPWYIGVDLRSLPAGRGQHQGLRGHRGRPGGRLPHPAHPVRGEGGRLDHRALLRPAFLPDSRRGVGRGS